MAMYKINRRPKDDVSDEEDDEPEQKATSKAEMDKIVPMLLLFKLIADRNETLSKKDEKLEAIIAELEQQNEDNADLLDELDGKQQELEDELLDQIQTPKAMSKFLKNILLIENLFNGYYSKNLRNNQQKARALSEPGISTKEKVKVKLEYDSETFGDIYNTAKIQMEIFNKFCVRMSSILKDNKIRLKYPAKANMKKAPRSFYKAYFWYTGDKSHNKLSDLLRTSFVFNTFDDLYKSYNLIAQNCKVVRVKDRFNAKQMPFGYRDCLLNVRCPGIKGSTPLICEVQLHHKAFYDNKKDSHKIYKTARLFETKKDKKKINFAYQSAKQYYSKIVGDKKYVKEPDYKEQSDNEDEELIEKLEYAQEQIENGVSVDELIAEFKSGDYEQYDDYSDYESEYSDYSDGSDEEWDEESEYEDEFDYDEYDEEEYDDDDYGDYSDQDDYEDDDDDGSTSRSCDDDSRSRSGDDDDDYDDDYDD